MFAASERPLNKVEVDAFCKDNSITLEIFLDDIARKIASGYSEGTLDFGYCDAVMNNLFSLMFLGYDNVPSDFTWSVFLAFDEGEYCHSGDPKSASPEELYTRPQLLALLENEKANHVIDPTRCARWS